MVGSRCPIQMPLTSVQSRCVCDQSYQQTGSKPSRTINLMILYFATRMLVKRQRVGRPTGVATLISSQGKHCAPLLFCERMRKAKHLTFFVEASCLALSERNENFGSRLQRYRVMVSQRLRWPNGQTTHESWEWFSHLMEVLMKQQF